MPTSPCEQILPTKVSTVVWVTDYAEFEQESPKENLRKMGDTNGPRHLRTRAKVPMTAVATAGPLRPVADMKWIITRTILRRSRLIST